MWTDFLICIITMKNITINKSKIKHYLKDTDLKPKQIEHLLTVSAEIKKHPELFSSRLKNKTVALLFEKTSLHTNAGNLPITKVTEQMFKLATKNAVFMHFLPKHPNEEVAEEVFESKRSLVFE